MGKYLIWLLYFAVFMVFVFIACDNGTEPDPEPPNGDDTTSTTLVIDFWTPEDGAVDISTGSSLYVRICDTSAAPIGVNPDSVFLTVNGVGVTFATIFNTCNGVDLRYIPTVDFEHGTTVFAAIAVADTGNNWLYDTISFTIEDFWDTTQYSIDTLNPLPGFAVRSRPVGSFTDQGAYFPNTSGTYTVIPGGAPYSLSFTPKRSFILTDIDGNIWAYNPDYSIQRQLTFDPATEKYPALSPNGHTLVFTRDGNIVLHNLADDSEEILASTAQGGRDFAFSADSQYLAYRSGAGSINPKIFVWRLEDREEIADPSLYNEVDCFDWSQDGNSIAVISNERLYFWRIDAGFPAMLYSADNLKFVNLTDYIYFVDSQPTGDIIMRVLPSGGTVETVIDLRPEASTVEDMALNNGGELVYAKNSGGTYTIEYYKIELGSGSTVSSDIGQTRQVNWY